MFKPEQMSRLLIAASRDQMGPVVAELYRRKLFHVEEFVEAGSEGYEGFKIGTPLSGANEKSTDLIKVRAIENTVSVHADDIASVKTFKQAEIAAKIERELPALEREVEELTARRSQLDTHFKECEQKIAEITPFVAVPVDLDLYHGYQGFTALAGYVSREVTLSVPHEMYFSKGKEKNFLVVIVPNDQKSEVERSLAEVAFQSVAIPVESGSPMARIEFYRSQATTLGAEIAEINEKLTGIRTKHAEFLVACEEFLKAEVEQTEAPLRFATTKQMFVAEGWVPSENVDEVSNALTQVTGGKIYVTALPIDLEHDAVPVEYNNPDFSKPTRMLIDLYSRPKYTELDPTLLVAIVFPIFFGLILGDVGYGLILLAMALGLRKFVTGEEGRQLLAVLRNASIMSIIFGLLFSEFLGFELPWNPIIFSRHLPIGTTEAGGAGSAIPALLIMSIWIGVLHISLGRVIGMYDHAKQDHGEHRTKAVMANFGWLAVMWGILVAIWSNVTMPYMPDLTKLPIVAVGFNLGTYIGGALIIFGILCIARDSVLEVIELPTIISHVLSYARLVAVGLSSVAIAMVINYIAIGMFISPALKELSLVGIVMIIVGVVIFIAGHTLNLALGLLGGGLHSIRLHYVEFFTKFYKGGGRKYIPFGMKRRFTED
ncbi:V-type ATP synthase subunit I [Methanoregula sp.]|jgi:V/A-type H+-transporting ATPase subunit I|uniref:V-type ATP synthase subunit I n=1 Tax=Methanoregula sp. TaxID=2052170 RepID=UPI0025FDBB23|nr:V-type ATP synthase subunit I [Methanoregula sp.]